MCVCHVYKYDARFSKDLKAARLLNRRENHQCWIILDILKSNWCKGEICLQESG